MSLVDLTDGEISSFRTELRALAVFVKYGRDKDRLQECLDGDPIFRHLSGDAVRLISECTHIKFKHKIRQEDNNMCQAIDEMMEIAYSKGKREKDERMQRRLLKHKNTIRKINSQLQQRDSRILQQENQLQQKDSQLQQKDSQLQQKDSQLQQKDSRILQQENQLQQKDSQLEEYKLNHIQTVRNLALKGYAIEDIAHIVNSSAADVQAIIESVGITPENSKPSHN